MPRPARRLSRPWSIARPDGQFANPNSHGCRGRLLERARDSAMGANGNWKRRLRRKKQIGASAGGGTANEPCRNGRASPENAPSLPSLACVGGEINLLCAVCGGGVG